jgi:pimeloyl-ACP methyl ester carboxylesterase
MKTPKPGYLNLHPDRSLNFLMNRLRSTIPPTELIEVGRNIETLEDWVREMLAAGQKAETDERLFEAANYYRGAEFYMVEGQAGKEEAYTKFLALHDQVFPKVALQRDAVPYGDGSLPTLIVPAKGKEKGVILIHSGFDGLVEEMYPRQVLLAEAGYRLVMFEGPGQGAALRHSGLHMPFDWEKPVGAILDHYDLESCTLIGMSLGGYLAPRAAAFDERISRVVIWGAMFDFLECFGSGFGQEQFEMLKQLIDDGEKETVNSVIESAMAANPTAAWAFRHGMHVCGAEDPFGFLKWAATMNLRDISDRIHQDVLIVMGSEDHLVPIKQFYRQIEALVNARSVTARLMTEKEHGAQHCQIGNTQIVINEILSWLDLLDKRDTLLQDIEPDISFEMK